MGSLDAWRYQERCQREPLPPYRSIQPFREPSHDVEACQSRISTIPRGSVFCGIWSEAQFFHHSLRSSIFQQFFEVSIVGYQTVGLRHAGRGQYFKVFLGNYAPGVLHLFPESGASRDGCAESEEEGSCWKDNPASVDSLHNPAGLLDDQLRHSDPGEGPRPCGLQHKPGIRGQQGQSNDDDRGVKDYPKPGSRPFLAPREPLWP